MYPLMVSFKGESANGLGSANLMKSGSGCPVALDPTIDAFMYVNMQCAELALSSELKSTREKAMRKTSVDS